MQKFIEAALDGKPLILRGGAGECVDFTQVDDIVEGIVRAIGNPAAMDETFNVTAGHAHTLPALAAMIEREVGPLTIVTEPRDADRPLRGTLSIDKARRLLGYEPRWPLEAGVKTYVGWYRSINWGQTDVHARKAHAAEAGKG